MDLDQLKQRFRYDPKTGNLYYINAGRSGDKEILATAISNGYIVVNPKESSRPLFAHRVAYQIYHNMNLGELIVDHIDQCKTNNKIENLRATTRAENNKNLALRKANKSGVSNVYQLPSGKWRAQIRVNKKNIHLGCFLTIEEAAEAKRKANQKYGFCINHN